MPRDGFNSITVMDAVYDKFYEWYESTGSTLSFPKFLQSKLEESLREKEKLQKFAKKIKKIPLVVKHYE